jgi:hypothetical protein
MALAIHDASSVAEAWKDYETLGERIQKAAANMIAKKLGPLEIDNEVYRLRGVDCLKRWVRALEIAIEDERTVGKSGRVQHGRTFKRGKRHGR